MLVRLPGTSEKNSWTSKYYQYLCDLTSAFFVTVWEKLFQNNYKTKKYFAVIAKLNVKVRPRSCGMLIAKTRSQTKSGLKTGT